ncbi:DNA ligase/mRNA capping enzyme [Boletus edulis BED1]|uniref:DNA ligase/mRNA capping enzyme n=1 Tax=Boletus edulis BED1 TaxID=1328754 RepID=A0AAD4C563_BOLED|nr:DNA ligase/mRNA capping enzyme [Boletus edulis BED1]
MDMDMDVQDGVKQITFSFFVSLLREIASIPARTTLSRAHKPNTSSSHSPRAVVHRWIEALRRNYSPLPRGATASVLRLLFPEDDTQRKFGLQETLLAQYLGQCLDSSTVFTRDAKQLKAWSQESASGCLGEELLKYAVPGTENAIGPKSLQEVDALLDELASTSLFSNKSFHDGNASMSNTKRSKSAILRSLYDSLPATDAAYLTQIILKDLRPLLYPPPSAMTSHVLLAYNTRSKQVLTREQFMKAWDPSGSMIKMYKVRAKLDEAAMGFEAGGTLVTAHPRWGVPVEIPKSAKGRSPLHALELLDTDGQIWAETKYDGERAQIHVRFCEDGQVKIAIFSKSKRDSTLDRISVHSIIKAALVGMEKQDVILDAEMVAFSDERNAIDEFWWIRGLVTRTAQGARATMNLSKGELNESQPLDSCPSLHSSPPESLHLALVFFDVLLLGSASLLNVPYSIRRSMLESIIQEIPGQAMIAERSMVSGGSEVEDAAKNLREIWAQRIADSQEGLVLKSGESTYGDWRLPWVKLKKDYVPGYGDTIDLVVIASSWEKDRARELRVSPSTLVTFYIGVLGNSSQCRANHTVKPHFVVYFTASYGLSREQLEEFNFWVRADAVEPSASRDELSYSYSILETLPQPTVVLQTPILVELCGAGFTKSPSSKYYELRFPRITKLFRSSERSFMECLTLRELQAIAYESTGREIQDANIYKDLDDWAKRLWGNGEAMDQERDQKGERRSKKHASLREEWESKFENLDVQRAQSRKGRHEDVEMSP